MLKIRIVMTHKDVERAKKVFSATRSAAKKAASLSKKAAEKVAPVAKKAALTAAEAAKRAAEKFPIEIEEE